MGFRKILREQVTQSVDLLEIYLFFLLPVFLFKGAVDFITQGQLFWRSYGLLFIASVGGFIVLFALIDLVTALHHWYLH
ncbi:hypothetical protein [Levilactobacillus yonginensis]|uniref:hypothetical protein n=1 Tax=Levilactobacillus yonginensis TaxID=1054041 RepID=UPI000F792148|nr:hypothetical protein [Levilactobacillus yonginensis]